MNFLSIQLDRQTISLAKHPLPAENFEVSPHYRSRATEDKSAMRRCAISGLERTWPTCAIMQDSKALSQPQSKRSSRLQVREEGSPRHATLADSEAQCM